MVYGIDRCRSIVNWANSSRRNAGSVVIRLITVKIDNVHERGVRTGHEGDECHENDEYVFGDGPSAHTLPFARRISAKYIIIVKAFPLYITVTFKCHVIEPRMVVSVMPVAVVLCVPPVIRVKVVVFVFVVPVAVLPERNQVDDGRAEQTQHREEHCSEQ